jgi:hypothetical protein
MSDGTVGHLLSKVESKIEREIFSLKIENVEAR